MKSVVFSVFSASPWFSLFFHSFLSPEFPGRYLSAVFIRGAAKPGGPWADKMRMSYWPEARQSRGIMKLLQRPQHEAYRRCRRIDLL